ncbi:MAG: hypothetical protein ACJ756_08345, partial [Solirubrobacterales bacterium]
MRVLCVGNMYPPHQWRLRAGLARRATALREAGHGVRVLMTDSRLPKAADLEEDEGHRDLRWPRAAIGSRACARGHACGSSATTRRSCGRRLGDWRVDPG